MMGEDEMLTLTVSLAITVASENVPPVPAPSLVVNTSLAGPSIPYDGVVRHIRGVDVKHLFYIDHGGSRSKPIYCDPQWQTCMRSWHQGYSARARLKLEAHFRSIAKDLANPERLEEGISSLRELACSPHTCDFIPDALLRLLLNEIPKASVRVCESACAALWSLLACDSMYPKLVLQMPAVSIIVQLFHDRPKDLTSSIVGCLACIATRKDGERLLLNQAGLRAVLDLLDFSADRLIENSQAFDWKKVYQIGIRTLSWLSRTSMALLLADSARTSKALLSSAQHLLSVKISQDEVVRAAMQVGVSVCFTCVFTVPHLVYLVSRCSLTSSRRLITSRCIHIFQPRLCSVLSSCHRVFTWAGLFLCRDQRKQRRWLHTQRRGCLHVSPELPTAVLKSWRLLRT
jgi:hypothetical protein